MSELNTLEKKKELLTDRQEKFSGALSYYARQITFENLSRRNLYRLAGLAQRRRDYVFSALLRIVFLVTFVLPFLGSVIYYFFIVTPQFESETRFVIRSAAPLLTSDRFSSNNAEPKQKIIQDTQVIISYLESLTMVDDLNTQMDLIQVYGRNDIDILSRLESDSKREDILKFWQSMYESWISPKSGIVELSVRAFTPEEAQQLLQVILDVAEERVNRLNGGIWSSLEASAERDLEFALSELKKLRLKMRDQQFKSGIIDLDETVASLSTLITGLESDYAQTKVEREVLSKSLSGNATLLREINHRIEAQENELKQLKERQTTRLGNQEESLANRSKEFKELELDLDIAEKRFSEAVEEFEKTKLLKSLQLVYVDRFIEPTLPEDNKYPNIPLALLFSFISCLVICGAFMGVIVILRQKLD